MRRRSRRACVSAVLALSVTAGAHADTLLEDTAPSTDVEALGESLRPPSGGLAKRLRRQLDRLEAEAEAARAAVHAQRRVDEAALGLRANRGDLERYRRRELADMARAELLEDLEWRLQRGSLRGGVSRSELERVRYRIDLRRAVDRVVERIGLERRVRELDRTRLRREAGQHRYQRSTPGLRLTR